MKNHIKVNLKSSVPVPALPPIPDLILEFASQTRVYKITVPASEMGKIANIFCKLMTEAGVVFNIEERLR